MLFKNHIQHLWKMPSIKRNGKKMAPTCLISFCDSDLNTICVLKKNKNLTSLDYIWITNHLVEVKPPQGLTEDLRPVFALVLIVLIDIYLIDPGLDPELDLFFIMRNSYLPFTYVHSEHIAYTSLSTILLSLKDSAILPLQHYLSFPFQFFSLSFFGCLAKCPVHALSSFQLRIRPHCFPLRHRIAFWNSLHFLSLPVYFSIKISLTHCLHVVFLL